MSKVGDKHSGASLSDIRDTYDNTTTKRSTSLNNYFNEDVGPGFYDPEQTKTFRSERQQSLGSIREVVFQTTQHMIPDDATRAKKYARDLSSGYPLSAYGLELELVMVADDSVDIYLKNNSTHAMGILSNTTENIFDGGRALPDNLETKSGFFGIGFSYEPAPTWDDDPNGDITFNGSDSNFASTHGFSKGNFVAEGFLYKPNTYSTTTSNPDSLNRMSVSFVAEPADDIRSGTEPFTPAGSAMIIFPNSRHKIASGVGNLPWPEKKIIERRNDWTGNPSELYPYTVPVGSADSTIKDIYLSGIAKINHQEDPNLESAGTSTLLRRFGGTAKKQADVRRVFYKGSASENFDFYHSNIDVHRLDRNSSMAVFVLTLSYDDIVEARNELLGSNHGIDNTQGTILLTKEMLLRNDGPNEKGFIAKHGYPKFQAMGVSAGQTYTLHDVIVQGDLTYQDDGVIYNNSSPIGTGVVLIFYRVFTESSNGLFASGTNANFIYSNGGSNNVNNGTFNKRWSTGQLRDSEENPLKVEHTQGALYLLNGVDTGEDTVVTRSFVHKPHSSDRVDGDPDQNLRKTLTTDGGLLTLSADPTSPLTRNEYCVIGGVSGATPVDAGTLTGFSNAVPDWLFDADGTLDYPTTVAYSTQPPGKRRIAPYHGVNDDSLSLSAELVDFSREPSLFRYGDPYGGAGYIYNNAFAWPDPLYTTYADDRIERGDASENSPNPYKFADHEGWSGDGTSYSINRDKSLNLKDLPKTYYWPWPSPSSVAKYINSYGSSNADFNYLHGVISTTSPIGMAYHTKAVEAVPRSEFTNPRNEWDSLGFAYNGSQYVFDITYNGYKLFDHSQNGLVTTFDIEGDMHSLSVTVSGRKGNHRISKILNSDPDVSNPLDSSYIQPVGREVETWRRILNYYKTGHNRGNFERLIGHRSYDPNSALAANRHSRFMYPDNPSYAKNYPNEGNILEYNLSDKEHFYAGGTFDSALTDCSIGCDAYALFGDDNFISPTTVNKYSINAPARYRANSRYANVLSILAVKWDTTLYAPPNHAITRSSIKVGDKKGVDDCFVQHYTTHPNVIDEYSSGHKSATLPYGDDYRETFTKYPGAHPNLISQQDSPVDCETFFNLSTEDLPIDDLANLAYNQSDLSSSANGDYLSRVELGFAWRIVCVEIDPEDNTPVYELYVSSASNIHGFGSTTWNNREITTNTFSVGTVANINPSGNLAYDDKVPLDGSYSPTPLENNGKRVERLICRFKPAKRNARNTKAFGADLVPQNQNDPSPSNTEIISNYANNQDFRNNGFTLSYQTTYPKYQIVASTHSSDPSVNDRSNTNTGLYANDKFRNSLVSSSAYRTYHGATSGLTVNTVIDDYPDDDPTYPVSLQKETHNIATAQHTIQDREEYIPAYPSFIDQLVSKFGIGSAFILVQEFFDKVLVRTVFSDDSSDVGIQFSSKTGNALEISFVTSDQHDLNNLQSGHIEFTTYFAPNPEFPENLSSSVGRLHVRIPEQTNNSNGGGHVIQIPAQGFTSTYWAYPYPDNTIANRGSKDTAIEFGDNPLLTQIGSGADNFGIGFKHLLRIDEFRTGIDALTLFNNHPDNISKFPLKTGPQYDDLGDTVYIFPTVFENQIYGGTKGQNFTHGFKSLDPDRSETGTLNRGEYQRQSYPIKGDGTNEWAPTTTTLDYYRDGQDSAGSQILDFDPVKVGNKVGAQIGGKFTTEFILDDDLNIGGWGAYLDPDTKQETVGYYDRIQKLSIGNIAPLDSHSDGRNLFSNVSSAVGNFQSEEGHDWEPHFNTTNVFFRTAFAGYLASPDLESNRMHVLVPFGLENPDDGEPYLFIAAPRTESEMQDGDFRFKSHDAGITFASDVQSSYSPIDATGDGHVYSPWYSDRSDDGFFGKTTSFDWDAYYDDYSDNAFSNSIIENEDAIVRVKRGDLVSFYLALSVSNQRGGWFGPEDNFDLGFTLKHENHVAGGNFAPQFENGKADVVRGVEGNGMPLNVIFQSEIYTANGQFIRWDTKNCVPGNYYLVAGQNVPYSSAFKYGEFGELLYIKIVVEA